MSHDVFVSYSSKDKAVADALVAALEAQNIRCWYAPRDIGPGMDWGKSITRAINQCSVMLLIFSSHANQSQHVLDEVYYAISEEKHILPFRIENLDPTDAMRLHLASRHWLDAFQPSWKAHIKRLISSLPAFLDQEDAPAETAAPPEMPPVLPVDPAGFMPEKKKRNWLWLGALVLPLLALLVWGIIPDSLLQQTLFNREQEQEETTMPVMATNPTTLRTEIPVPDVSTTWDQNFGPLMIDLIANRNPDFEDTFSYQLEEWGEFPPGIVQDSGKLQFVGTDVILSKEHLSATDFVLEFDVIVPDPQTNTANFGIDFRVNPDYSNHKYSFLMSLQNNSDGNYWAIIRNDLVILSNGVSSEIQTDTTMTIRLMAKRDQFVVYLNNQPLAYFQDDTHPNGSLAITFANPDNVNGLESSLDNLKFWNLDSLWLVNYKAFALPILESIALVAPDYEDDFSTQREEWGNKPAGVEISDGQLRSAATQYPYPREDLLGINMISQGDEFPLDYVLQFDFEVDDSLDYFPIVIEFRADNFGSYLVSHENLGGSNYWAARLQTNNFSRSENIALEPANALPIDKLTRLTLIVKGDQYILILQGVEDIGPPAPDSIFYFQNRAIEHSRGLALGFQYHEPVPIKIDNLKIWDLDNNYIEEFINPVIQLIDSSNPDFEDDFTVLNPDWEIAPDMYISDGVLVMATPGDYLRGEMIQGRNFAIEFTLKINFEREYSPLWRIFRMREIGGAGDLFWVDTAFTPEEDHLAWSISTEDPPSFNYNGTTETFIYHDFNRFLFIVEDNKSSVYINDELLNYFEDDSYVDSWKQLWLSMEVPDVKFFLDHLRFWQLGQQEE